MTLRHITDDGRRTLCGRPATTQDLSLRDVTRRDVLDMHTCRRCGASKELDYTLRVPMSFG